MIKLPEPVAPDETEEARPLASRLFWFIGIALASAALVITVAYALRGLLFL